MVGTLCKFRGRHRQGLCVLFCSFERPTRHLIFNSSSLFLLQLLEELERRVDSDDFAQSLTEERNHLREQQQQNSNTAAEAAQVPACGSEISTPDWWETVPGQLGISTISEDTGDYVVVEHADVVNALAAFLAAYIVALPEGQSMEPKQLQHAVRQALREIRKGRVRKLWDWGRFLYRAAAMSYGAFAAYTNPWIAEAVLKALFTCARFARTFW